MNEPIKVYLPTPDKPHYWTPELGQVCCPSEAFMHETDIGTKCIHLVSTPPESGTLITLTLLGELTDEPKLISGSIMSRNGFDVTLYYHCVGRQCVPLPTPLLVTYTLHPVIWENHETVDPGIFLGVKTS